MTTFVLVHGAWHGGWCWRKVAQTLVAKGHAVFAPTLTGLGDRAHLLSRDTSLEMHVRDILAALEAEDLKDVVLVGHSYGGIVVSAVADRGLQRVARLVYLDAVVARNGECMFDRSPAQVRTHFEAHAQQGGEGWCVPVSALSPQFLGLKDEADIRWVMPRLTPHPIRTFSEPVRLSASFPQMPRTYINCIGDKQIGQPRTPQADGIDDYHEIQAGHDAMIAAPQQVVTLLGRVPEA
jgi:pimeloyl-ACP methyl ester carboxylesterase